MAASIQRVYVVQRSSGSEEYAIFTSQNGSYDARSGHAIIRPLIINAGDFPLKYKVLYCVEQDGKLRLPSEDLPLLAEYRLTTEEEEGHLQVPDIGEESAKEKLRMMEGFFQGLPMNVELSETLAHIRSLVTIVSRIPAHSCHAEKEVKVDLSFPSFLAAGASLAFIVKWLMIFW